MTSAVGAENVLENSSVIPAEPIPTEPAASSATYSFQERFTKMFLTLEEGPVATNSGPAAHEATVEYTLDVYDAMNTFWNANKAEIKRRCGPSMPKGLIDGQECFAFAVNDGLGRPLLPHDAARGVGQTGYNIVAAARGSGKPPNRRKGSIEKARDAAREGAREAARQAREAAASDPSLPLHVYAPEAAMEAATAKVLGEPVDLKLPNATVGAKRKRAATATPDANADPLAVKLAQCTEEMDAAEVAFRAAVAALDAAEEEDRCNTLRMQRAERRQDEVALLSAQAGKRQTALNVADACDALDNARLATLAAVAGHATAQCHLLIAESQKLRMAQLDAHEDMDPDAYALREGRRQETCRRLDAVNQELGGENARLRLRVQQLESSLHNTVSQQTHRFELQRIAEYAWFWRERALAAGCVDSEDDLE